MNMLLLGGNGFIGSHLIDKLLYEGHRVTVYDKYMEYFRKPLKDVQYIYGDLGNRGVLGNSLHGIDIVFHLVSTTNPETSGDDAEYDIMSNVVNTIKLLEECVNNHVPKFVFVSSGGTVYGIPHHLPVKETEETNPISAYGISKLAIEKYVHLFHFHYGIQYTIVRPSNPYGHRQNPKGNQGLVSVVVNKILRGETVEIWGDGSIVRDYIYVKDLAEGIYRASLHESHAGIYNLGTATGYTINEILAFIKNISMIDFSVTYKPMRNFDVPKIILDISKAKEILQWQPTVQIEEGIRRTVEFYKEINHIK